MALAIQVGKVGDDAEAAFSEGILDQGSSCNVGASSQTPHCPDCSSKKLWRNGFRHQMFGPPIQVWVCRECGLKFSDPDDVAKAKKAIRTEQELESRRLTKTLKGISSISSSCQICVSETKNLVAEQISIEVPQNARVDLKSAIVDFLWQLKKQNYSEDTLRSYDYSLQALAATGIDLFNPESFLEKMPLQNQWTSIRKYNLTKAYRCFLNLHKIQAKLPKYKVTRPLPYIPPQEFLDQLIASCNSMMASFLQTLKETAARPGEAWRLNWDDLDIVGKKLTISHPEKGCNPRIRPISDRLLQMLLALPREPSQKRIFTYKSKHDAGKTFRRMRQRAMQKLGNSELRKIDFYTFRYWKATMEYRRTRDFGHIMVLLGHKSLRYVLLYAQLSDACDTDQAYVCKEARSRQEAAQLIEAGFEYVMDKEGASLFRKIK